MRAVATVPVLPPPPGGSVLEGAALPPASPERPLPPPRRPSPLPVGRPGLGRAGVAV